jgi:hypothetical protein
LEMDDKNLPLSLVNRVPIREHLYLFGYDIENQLNTMKVTQIFVICGVLDRVCAFLQMPLSISLISSRNLVRDRIV